MIGGTRWIFVLFWWWGGLYIFVCQVVFVIRVFGFLYLLFTGEFIISYGGTRGGWFIITKLTTNHPPQPHNRARILKKPSLNPHNSH